MLKKYNKADYIIVEVLINHDEGIEIRYRFQNEEQTTFSSDVKTTEIYSSVFPII
jgi:hypothetical protein